MSSISSLRTNSLIVAKQSNRQPPRPIEPNSSPANAQQPIQPQSNDLDTRFLNFLAHISLFPGSFIPGKTKLKNTRKFFAKQKTAVAGRGLPNFITKVRFQSSNGTTHYAWFVPPEKGKPTILYSGGNADSLRSISRFTPFLASTAEGGNGYGFFCFEYPGYGRTKGAPSEQTLQESLEAASDFLQEQKNIPASQQIMYGLCMGGALTAKVAANRAVKAIVLESTMPSVPELIKQEFNRPSNPFKSLEPEITGKIQAKFDALDAAPNIHCPTFIIHANQDPISPAHFARRLYEKIGTPSEQKHMVLIPHTQHVMPKAKTQECVKLFFDHLNASTGE